MNRVKHSAAAAWLTCLSCTLITHQLCDLFHCVQHTQRRVFLHVCHKSQTSITVTYSSSAMYSITATSPTTFKHSRQYRFSPCISTLPDSTRCSTLHHLKDWRGSIRTLKAADFASVTWRTTRILLPRAARSTKCGIAIVSKLSVRPSACLSVKLTYHGRICRVSSKVITRVISLGSSLLRAPTSAIPSKGNTPKFGWNKDGVAVFSRKPAISRKRSKIGRKLLLMTNRKLHTLSIGTKINDLGWPWTAITHCLSKYLLFWSQSQQEATLSQGNRAMPLLFFSV